MSAYILETLSYAITLAYAVNKDFPFSTYGENLFLTLQNTLVTLLIIFYAPGKQSKTAPLTAAIIGSVLTAVTLSNLPGSTLSLLQVSTLPLSLFSKLPQIQQNYRSRSTGQLSAFAVISQIAGCLARLFTTATEVGDTLVAAGFALALALNLVLGAQLWMYWGKDEINLGTQKKMEKEISSPAYEPAPWQQPVAATRVATPPPGSPSLGGRKWARKVD